MKKISIVIPMYNEQEVAEICYQRIKNVLTRSANSDIIYSRQADA